MAISRQNGTRLSIYVPLINLKIKQWAHITSRLN